MAIDRLDTDLVDDRIWDSIPEEIKMVLINTLNNEIIFNLAFTIATHLKDELAQLDVSGMPADEFRQQYAALQFKFGFWHNFPAWVVAKRLELNKER